MCQAGLENRFRACRRAALTPGPSPKGRGEDAGDLAAEIVLPLSMTAQASPSPAKERCAAELLRSVPFKGRLK